MDDGTDYGRDISPCNNDDKEMINGEAGVCDADHCVNMIMGTSVTDQDMSPSLSQPFIAIHVSLTLFSMSS